MDQEEKTRQTITFSAKIQPVEKINDSFLKCKIWVCALGKNRNLSCISKDAADDAQYSLYNIPIIGHLYEGKDGEYHMGGHDAVLEMNANGKISSKPLCVPYGVVPAQDNVHYEDVVDPDGVTRQYIVADGILWLGRFPELAEAVYSKDWLFSQSMEIDVLEWEKMPAETESEPEYVEIKKYTYSALCLLGKSDDEDYDVEPCFPEAHIAVAEYENSTFAALMKQFKEELSECFSKSARKEENTEMNTEEMIGVEANVENTIPEENVPEAEENAQGQSAEFAQADQGADEMIDNPEIIVSDEAIGNPEATDSDEMIDNPEIITVQNDEEAAAPVEEAPAVDGQASDEAPAVDYQAEESPNQDAEMRFGFVEKLEALRRVVAQAQSQSGEERACAHVFDFDEKYVYIIKYSWTEEGIDLPAQYYRTEYSFNEEGRTATLSGMFEHMVMKLLTDAEEEQLNAMRSDYEALTAYKAQREEEDRKRAIDAALEPFADLSGNEEFEALAANKYSHQGSVEELVNACYAIRGKYGLTAKGHKSSEPYVPVGAPRENNLTPREKLHQAYGRNH